MSSSSGVSVRPATRPLSQTAQEDSIPKPRPGYNRWGRPLKDQDVWGGIKTPEGKSVNTADGISEDELAALADLFEKDMQQFVHRLGADSKNGTPVTYSRKDEIFRGGTLESTFTARDGKLHVQARLEITQKVAQAWLEPYLAPPDKQITAPVTAEITLTGEIDRKGEIASLKAAGSLANIPRFSAQQAGEFEVNEWLVLLPLKEGETITKELRETVGRTVAYLLTRTSKDAVLLGRELLVQDPAIEIDVRRKGNATQAHLEAGKHGLGVRIDHLLDVAGKYPRIDASTDASLDKQDHDTFDVGNLKARSTEKLVMGFKENRPHLYRIEKDGSRTELQNPFLRVFALLPFLRVGIAAGGGTSGSSD